MSNKTGIELIAQERQEQTTKHGWSQEHDNTHVDGELKYAALFALGEEYYLQPYGWHDFEDSINRKSEIEKLIIAGALIAAEIDRLISIE